MVRGCGGEWLKAVETFHGTHRNAHQIRLSCFGKSCDAGLMTLRH